MATYATLMFNTAGRSSDATQAYNDVVDSQSSLVGYQNAASFPTYFQENPSYVHPNAASNTSLVTVFDAMVGRFRTWKAA